MPNPRTQRPGRPHLARDQQQWIFDYIVQETHAVFHWWSDDQGHFPASVRSHAMISKHLGKEGQRLEKSAELEEASGNLAKAVELYFAATLQYMVAQHALFESNAEKKFLFSSMQRSYDKVRELNTYKIERIEIPWNDTVVTGYLHLCPDQPVAPLLFYVPGCDATSVQWPNPLSNPAFKRGMHVFSFDGPGQGQSNLDGIRLTADNYEQAARAALDQLLLRPEIDSDKVVALGGGLGAFWALRFAALDHRLKAVATKSSYAEKYYLMDEDSPRFKQLFAYMTGADTEDELDREVAKMTLDGYMSKIDCPTLMATGEYNLRDPIEEVYELFDQMEAPAELWVFADQFHKLTFGDTERVFGLYGFMLDWLNDRLAGDAMKNAGEVLYIEPGSAGPDSPTAYRKRRWYET